MASKHYDKIDFTSPKGEEKRITATLRSYGARNPTNVVQRLRLVVIGEGEEAEDLVEATWISYSGQYSERRWAVSVLFDTAMMTPGSTVKLDTTGSDGQRYHYTIPRAMFDKFLTQRAGYDYSEFLRQHHRSYWVHLGGYKDHDMYTIPVGTQWSLGQLGFHTLKDGVSKTFVSGDPAKVFPDISTWLETPTVI